jgi:hypothetical protein
MCALQHVEAGRADLVEDVVRHMNAFCVSPVKCSMPSAPAFKAWRMPESEWA